MPGSNRTTFKGDHMGLGDIFKGAVGAVAGAGKGVLSALPQSITTVIDHTVAGVQSPPSLPDLPSAISQAATTPHPAGGTVLDHYVQAGCAVVLGVIVPHIPFLPAGIKTAISAGLVAFAIARVDAAVKHMESVYVAPVAHA
jgi:hypothetical protein